MIDSKVRSLGKLISIILEISLFIKLVCFHFMFDQNIEIGKDTRHIQKFGF